MKQNNCTLLHVLDPNEVDCVEPFLATVNNSNCILVIWYLTTPCCLQTVAQVRRHPKNIVIFSQQNFGERGTVRSSTKIPPLITSICFQENYRTHPGCLFLCLHFAIPKLLLTAGRLPFC